MLLYTQSIYIKFNQPKIIKSLAGLHFCSVFIILDYNVILVYYINYILLQIKKTIAVRLSDYNDFVTIVTDYNVY